MNNPFVVELLLSIVAESVSFPLHPHDAQNIRAFEDSLAFAEITTFETAPFEDSLAAGRNQSMDTRRPYYRVPLKKTSHPGDDDVYRTVDYPRESLASVNKQSQIIVVFYHGEETT
jgi:hypothetical protein